MVGELSSVVEVSKPEFVNESNVSSDIIDDPCNDGTPLLEVEDGSHASRNSENSHASRDGDVTLRNIEAADSDLDSIPSGSDPHFRESVSSEQRGATSCCTSCDVTVDATRTSDNGVAISGVHAAIGANRRSGNEELKNRGTDDALNEAQLRDRSSPARCNHACCSTDHTSRGSLDGSTHDRSTHDGSTVTLDVDFANLWAQSLGVAFGAVISEVESHVLTSQQPVPIDELSQMIEASLSELVLPFGTQDGSAAHTACSSSAGGVVTAGAEVEAATLCASARLSATCAAAGAVAGPAVAVKHAPLPHAFLAAALSTFRTCARVRRALARTVQNQAVPSQAFVPPAATAPAAAPASAPSAPGSGWLLRRHGHGCSRGTTGGFEGEGARKGELGTEAGAGAGKVTVGEEGTGEEGVDDELVGEEGMEEDGVEKEQGVGVLSSLISSYDPMAAVLLQSEVAAGVEGHTDEQKEKGEQTEKRGQKAKGEQREKRERKKGLSRENGGEEEELGMTGECTSGGGVKKDGSTGKRGQSKQQKGQGTGKEERVRQSRQGEPRRSQGGSQKQQRRQHTHAPALSHSPAHSHKPTTPVTLSPTLAGTTAHSHAPESCSAAPAMLSPQSPSPPTPLSPSPIPAIPTRSVSTSSIPTRAPESRSPPSHAYQSVSPFYALVFEANQKQTVRTPENHAALSHACQSVSPPHAPQSHSPESQSPIPAIPTCSVSTSSIPARTPESHLPPSHAYQSVSPPYAPLSHAPESIAPSPSSPVAPPTHPYHQSSTSGEPHSHDPLSSHLHQSHPRQSHLQQSHLQQSHLYQPHPYQPVPAHHLALSHTHSTLSHSITAPSHAFTSHALTSHTVTAPTPSLLALRYVTALEERNRLSAAKLSQSALSVSLHAQHLAATDLSNHLMAQKVELSKGEKARREREVRERRGREELAGFARACADELVAGLLVMLVVIGATGWRFAGERLAAGVAACQVRHDPALDASSFLGVSFSRPDRSLVTWLRLIGCKLTVAGQMLLAFLVASATTYIMLLNNVAAATGAGSAHSRPATTIVLCLGCVCGYFGFYAVRLAGGDAVVWLVCWEGLCVLHAMVAWRKEQLFRVLYGRMAGEEVGKLEMGAEGEGERRGGMGDACAGSGLEGEATVVGGVAAAGASAAVMLGRTPEAPVVPGEQGVRRRRGGNASSRDPTGPTRNTAVHSRDTTGREHSGENNNSEYGVGSGRGSSRGVGWKGHGIGKMLGSVWRRMAEIVTAVMDDDVDGLVMGRWWAGNRRGSDGRSASRRSSSSLCDSSASEPVSSSSARPSPPGRRSSSVSVSSSSPSASSSSESRRPSGTSEAAAASDSACTDSPLYTTVSLRSLSVCARLIITLLTSCFASIQLLFTNPRAFALTCSKWARSHCLPRLSHIIPPPPPPWVRRLLFHLTLLLLLPVAAGALPFVTWADAIRFIGALFSEVWMMAAGWVWQERGWDGFGRQGYGQSSSLGVSAAKGASGPGSGGGMAQYREDDL